MRAVDLVHSCEQQASSDELTMDFARNHLSAASNELELANSQFEALQDSDGEVLNLETESGSPNDAISAAIDAVADAFACCNNIENWVIDPVGSAAIVSAATEAVQEAEQSIEDASDLLQGIKRADSRYQSQLNQASQQLTAAIARAGEQGLDMSSALMPAQVALLHATRAQDCGDPELPQLLEQLEAAVQDVEQQVRQGISDDRANWKIIGDHSDRVERLSERLQGTVAQLEASNIKSDQMQESSASCAELVSDLISTMRRGPADDELEEWSRCHQTLALADCFRLALTHSLKFTVSH